jgi:hypothetical protein
MMPGIKFAPGRRHNAEGPADETLRGRGCPLFPLLFAAKKQPTGLWQ